MNEYVKPDLNQMLDAGRFDPNCAESSWILPANWYFDPQIYHLEHEKPEYSEHHVHFFQQMVYRALNE